jgi:hypothetical protein
MSDKEFLQWIHDRLENVHKENRYYDYMWRLRAIANATPSDQKTLPDCN